MLFKTELVCILQQLDKLLFSKLSASSIGACIASHDCLSLVGINELALNRLTILIKHDHLLVIITSFSLLLHLLLLDQQLFLLLMAELLQELLLLLRGQALQHLEQLHVVLLLLHLLNLVLLGLHSCVGLLDARVDDVLGLSFFLLRWHLVDDLLLILLVLCCQESCLLGCKLFLCRLVGALLPRVVMRASTLEGWEEVVE